MYVAHQTPGGGAVGYAVGWVEEITRDFQISAGIIQLLI